MNPSHSKVRHRAERGACTSKWEPSPDSVDDAPDIAELLRIGALPLSMILARAGALRDQGHGDVISYSPKVFIPLTRACRDVCHYCTFAKPPRRGENVFLSPDEVVAIARAGQEAGCHEALFTLGDKPELRYRRAADELEELGFSTTIEYLIASCNLVLTETGLLPHANPGVVSAGELRLLRQVTASQGIMLESASDRLCHPGQVHHGSPDKHPAQRLACIGAAGKERVPFTSGILIGIGESRGERLEALLALRALHEQTGHLQEIIVQNFRRKSGTRLAAANEPELDELLWTIAMARIAFGPEMNIQAPPNLSPGVYQHLIAAGLNDWGGISPVTVDHVNPEAPWPALTKLAEATRSAGKYLQARLPIYPAYASNPDWSCPAVFTKIQLRSDTEGWARTDAWAPGLLGPAPAIIPCQLPSSDVTHRILDRASAGSRLTETEIVTLFAARGSDFDVIVACADALRHAVASDTVTYVVNRNINYTNVCSYRCRFCAFSKGKSSVNLRGFPYDLTLDEIGRRASEAWTRGATEVCLQGGIHPDYTGDTYLAICKAVKKAAPKIHIHAFSPLEVTHGARTTNVSIPTYLAELRAAGLDTLPGTAAEILDDEVRAIICPDKINTREWLEVIGHAHALGLRTTATIMFGHVERSIHWARHLLRVRDLQSVTGGFTEFVPLPFVHMEAPLYFQGKARPGPTYRESILMHAVSRLVLYPVITNIQVSWVKLGIEGAKACLDAGANDLGGVLMNESISRAAGTQHGQELSPAEIERLVSSLGRAPRQRDTLYGTVSAERFVAANTAPPLLPLIQSPAGKLAQARSGH